jgi:hypothetical protein
MLYLRKLNIYLNFQRLSAEFGERVANAFFLTQRRKATVFAASANQLLKLVDTQVVDN